MDNRREKPEAVTAFVTIPVSNDNKTEVVMVDCDVPYDLFFLNQGQFLINVN